MDTTSRPSSVGCGFSFMLLLEKMLTKENQILADSIQVFDNALPEKMLAGLQSLYQVNWSYGWGVSSSLYPCWGSLFEGSICPRQGALDDAVSQSAESSKLRRVWHHIRDTYLPDQELIRSGGVAYTYGTEGPVHSDSDSADALSILVYIHPQWEAAWAGDLAYYTLDRTDVIKVVSPRPGRIVIAPGFIPHRAYAARRDVDHLRACINFRVRSRELKK
jgi:SM-20-related protein